MKTFLDVLAITILVVFGTAVIAFFTIITKGLFLAVIVGAAILAWAAARITLMNQ